MKGVLRIAMSKYRNSKTVIDGIKFDSAAEGARYQILKAKEKAGLIKNLELQKNYPMIINGLKTLKHGMRNFQNHRPKKLSVISFNKNCMK